MELDKKIKITKNLKKILLIMACFYFAMWVLSCISQHIYSEIAKYVYFIPAIFDNIFNSHVEFGNNLIPMGNFQAAIALLIGSSICKGLNNRYKNEKRLEEEEEQKRKFIVEQRTKRTQVQKKTRNVQYKESFFGLLDIHLDYSDSFGKDSKELDNLKIEYYKILIEKLETKHNKVKFVQKNKMFFYSNYYGLLNVVTKDILKVLDVIIKISKNRQIKVTVYLSYWIDDKNANKTGIYRALDQINKFENPNKIIITDGVYLKITAMEYEPWCKVNPIGTYKLYKIFDDQDIQVDLYEMTSIK